MLRNKKVWLALILVIVLAGFFLINLSTNDKGVFSTGETENKVATDYANIEWFTYEDSRNNFSFNYPKEEDTEVSTGTGEHVVRVQNYKTSPLTHRSNLEGKYWLEFFVFSEDITRCTERMLSPASVSLNNMIIYKGKTIGDRNSGVGGGLEAACIEKENYILYTQGQDYTGENIIDQIVNSISFTD